jgi:SAM-dependent methyltransferase
VFEVAAGAYDRFMGVYSAQLAPQLADLANVRGGQTVLDVGCGTGTLTQELVRRVGGQDVAAVDPSESFVGAIRERYPDVRVELASAEDLPFPDDSFDAALAQLVIHFMPDAVSGVREMARVTRSGGAIAASAWDFGGDRSPMAVFWRAAKELDPDVEDESDLTGVQRGRIAEVFREAGLKNVEQAEHVATREFATLAEWWELFTHGVGPSGAYVQSLDDERRSDLRQRCGELFGPPPITIDAVAWAARGTA